MFDNLRISTVIPSQQTGQARAGERHAGGRLFYHPAIVPIRCAQSLGIRRRFFHDHIIPNRVNPDQGRNLACVDHAIHPYLDRVTGGGRPLRDAIREPGAKIHSVESIRRRSPLLCVRFHLLRDHGRVPARGGGSSSRRLIWRSSGRMPYAL